MSVPLDVTVIVPVYDTVDYLQPCLESLVGQTIGHERLEVVAVDDGSTDGSGELLEAYAAAHPDVFRVIHQGNSGGPARPCNVGLDHATGRFVFFLGSDDYLALDALERLVQRADEWDADVVVPPAEGVGGRHVDQRVFRAEHPDLAFPGDLLPFSISNTKLFRRSLLEENGLRYPLDLAVGSDQPFTVAAMLHARRVGVLGRPTAYFGVKREDHGNITYRTSWRTRLENLTAIIDHLCDLLPTGERRDALLVRHFTWELDKLLTRDLPRCDDAEGQELVDALGKVAQELLTDGVRRRLPVRHRLRWHHVLAGDTVRLRRVLADPPEPGPLVIEPGGFYLPYRGFREDVEDWVFAIPDTNVAKWVAGIDRESEVVLDGNRIVLTATTKLVDPASAPQLRLALSPLHRSGVPRGALDVPRGRGTRVLASTPVTISPDGQVRAELDLEPFAQAGGGRAGLRLRIVTDGRVIDRPVRVVADADGEIRTPDWQGTTRLTSSLADRVLVDVTVEQARAGGIRGRLRR